MPDVEFAPTACAEHDGAQTQDRTQGRHARSLVLRLRSVVFHAAAATRPPELDVLLVS